MLVLSGSSHPEFVKLVIDRLDLPQASVKTSNFANGELCVDIGVSVRDKTVFVVQTCFGNVNDLLMELMIMIYACKMSSAKRGTLHTYNPVPLP